MLQLNRLKCLSCRSHFISCMYPTLSLTYFCTQHKSKKQEKWKMKITKATQSSDSSYKEIWTRVDGKFRDWSTPSVSKTCSKRPFWEIRQIQWSPEVLTQQSDFANLHTFFATLPHSMRSEKSSRNKVRVFMFNLGTLYFTLCPFFGLLTLLNI